MDILSDVIQSAGVQSTLLTRNAFYQPWAVRFPCRHSAGFHIVTQGTCWVRGGPHFRRPVRMERGDVLFVSRGVTHEVASDLRTRATPISDLPEMQTGTLTKNGTEPRTTLVSGVYRLRTEPLHPFFAELPPSILLRAQEVSAHHPIYSALQLLSAEVEEGRPGAEVVMHRLMDILFYYIFRRWVDRQAEQPRRTASWSAALLDPHLSKALRVIHAEVARDWSVAELARASGLSRATFALRFKTVLGDTPARYVAGLRVQRASVLLKTTSQGLEEIAAQVGYHDPFAFSRAFKRLRQVSPRAFRASRN